MVLIWDGVIRIFHISLIYAMVGVYITSENGAIERHALWGITIISLLVCRVLWGFLGSFNARFKNFLFSPKVIYHYLKGFLSPKASHYMGHNPVGGLSVVMMLFLLLLQAISGLAMTDDIFFEGPLYSILSQDIYNILDMLHRQNFNILILIVFIHITAVFYYLLYKKNDLISPMITGKKISYNHPQDKTLYAAYSKTALLFAVISSVGIWLYLYMITDI